MVKAILAYNPEREAFGEEVLGAISSGMATEQPLVGDMKEMEYASELLEAREKRQLEQALRNMLGAFSRLGSESPATIALGSLMGPVATRALPTLSPLALRVSPHARATAQRHLSNTAAELFGMELEGLSDEDQEFEAAKGLVRLAASAAANLKARDARADPAAAAKAALAAAARAHAPGLLIAQGVPRPEVARAAGAGRWERRGRSIVITGV